MYLALLVVLAAAPATQSWEFQTNGSPRIEVEDVNGSIRVEGVEGVAVKVESRQEGTEEERARYPVEVRQDGDKVTVKLCCGPCREVVKSCHRPVATHFVLKVPKKAMLDVSGVEASIHISDVEGAQDVSTVEGDVEVRGSRGDLEVSAVSGNVTLSPAALQDTEISTVSGKVSLQLPAPADADVEVSAVGGSFNGRSLDLGSKEVRYGQGSHSVEISTVGGAIEVRPAG